MSETVERAALSEAVAARRDWAVETLEGLVRHPSTLGQERSAQEYLAGVLEQMGLAPRLVPIEVDKISKLPGFSPVDWSYEGRPNLVARHQVDESVGRSLILNGHVDVVPPDPVSLWTGAPFEPRRLEQEGDDWIVGRGAGDMKGGTVACLWALAALDELGLEPASTVIVESPIEEECTGNGTLALRAAGGEAEGCVIPEPFSETLLIRQLGVLWFQVRVLGRTTHVLGAGRGVNAIEKSFTMIEALRALEQELNQPDRVPEGYQGVEHPLNLNVGIIRGGDWASTVAGECLTRYRLGVYPGESCAEMRKLVEQRVAEVAEADPWLKENPPAVEYVGFQAEGCEVDQGSPLMAALSRAHRCWRGAEPEPLVATATTDVRFFEHHGDRPATCYGPHAVDIHGADERVSLGSMTRVAEVMATFLGDWCGLRRKHAGHGRR